jgi:UDP-N-acetylmuramoyl-tripeptide--D-alanyl-D-alanine ligase
MTTPIPENHASFTLAEAAAATGGILRGDGAASATSVSIDTRTLRPGALFVALRGESNDGHGYLPQAARLDAAGAIVEPGRASTDLPCIEVADPLAALGLLAHRHVARIRKAHAVASVAIGGAVGKTSTKELTAAAARALFGPTLATAGNLNNLIGVPMTMLCLEPSHRAMVIECGTNTRGEIPRLQRIVEPDVAMVLNVDIEHSEGLGTLDEIADEEAALFSGARRLAVASADEPRVLARIPPALATITFGTSERADVRLLARAVTAPGRSRLTIKLDSRLVAPGDSPVMIFEIGMLGAGAALNCAAAVAAMAAMRAERLTAAQLDAIGAALGAVAPVAGRLCARDCGGVFVIDDTYNSSPRAIKIALDAAREIASGLRARLLIVLGDMFELGAVAREAHAEAVSETLAAAPAAFVAVGPQMTAALDAAGRSGAAPIEIASAPDSVAAGPVVRAMVRPGDVLLVKGARAMAMERVIDALASPD